MGSGGGAAGPTAPTGLTATPVSVSQINLAWTDNATDETAYKVYRSTNGTDYAQVGDDLAAGATSYNDTTVTTTTYYYKVAAVNASGEGLSTAVQTTVPIFKDTFTDVNGTALTSHTPDIGAVGFSALSTGVEYDIQGNRAHFKTAGGANVTGFDSGVANARISARLMGHSSTSTTNPAIVFRYVDDSNYWRLRIRFSNGDVQLFKLVNNSGSQPTGGLYTFAFQLDTVYAFDIVCNGASIKVYLGGDLIMDVTDSALQTATKVGLRGARANGFEYSDDFTVQEVGGVYPFDVAAAGPQNAAAPLTTPTYDDSGQAVHPDVIDFGAGQTWNGYRYWMAMTPYTGGSDRRENPSMLVSSDKQTWIVPPGLTNPIIPDPYPWHNSDTCIAVDADSRMWLYYRRSRANTDSDVRVISSLDGVHWSDPVILVTSLVVTQTNLSPSVMWDGSQWVMYVIDASAHPSKIVRRTCATPDGEWSDPVECTLAGLPTGWGIWHMNAGMVGSRFVAWAYVTPDSLAYSGNIHYLDSVDGLSWQMDPLPSLMYAYGTWDNNRMYQPAWVYLGSGLYDVWYSATNAAGEWHIGYTQLRHELMVHPA
jgi:hypothetical protein